MVVTQHEQHLLELAHEGSKTFGQLNYLLTQTEELRSTTVSGLLAGLVASDYLAKSQEGHYSITELGLQALSGNLVEEDLPATRSKLRKSRPGDGPILKQQGLQREYLVQSNASVPVSLERVTLSQGEECTPHAHIGTETVVFTVSGRVRVFSGPQLADVIDMGPEDCLYIPPDEPHYVVNLWSEPMVAIVARFMPRGVVELPALRRWVPSDILTKEAVSA